MGFGGVTVPGLGSGSGHMGLLNRRVIRKSQEADSVDSVCLVRVRTWVQIPRTKVNSGTGALISRDWVSDQPGPTAMRLRPWLVSVLVSSEPRNLELILWGCQAECSLCGLWKVLSHPDCIWRSPNVTATHTPRHHTGPEGGHNHQPEAFFFFFRQDLM